jgi:hypothetical protein
MIFKRFVAAALVFCLGFVLGSCSPFSGFVSDSWPHFAGGEPHDLPPRPGTPGYAAFIAHGQPSQNAAPAAADPQHPVTGDAQHPVTATSALGPDQGSAATNQKPPSAPGEKPAAPDQNIVQGGLY